MHRKSLVIIAVTILLAASVVSQTTEDRSPVAAANADMHEWSYYFNIAGYLVPHDRSYASPTFDADLRHFHFGARYNYEDKETGSLWFGYNISVGRNATLEITPMLGGVVGNTAGIAPGCKAALSWKHIALSTEDEFVFDLKNQAGTFFYSWSELSYSPMKWWRAGIAAQRTKAYHTELDIQRGVLLGLSGKKLDFTTYIFNAGWTDPTIVLSLGFSF